MPARVVVNRANVRELINSPNGPVALDLERRLIRVQNDAKRRCPVDKGRLRGSITHEIIVVRGQLVGRVGTNVNYATAVHEGRGPVVPVHARVLRFIPKGGGPAVFTTYVKGTVGQPFLRLALAAAA